METIDLEQNSYPEARKHDVRLAQIPEATLKVLEIELGSTFFKDVFEQQMVTFLNDYRAAYGVGELDMENPTMVRPVYDFADLMNFQQKTNLILELLEKNKDSFDSKEYFTHERDLKNTLDETGKIIYNLDKKSRAKEEDGDDERAAA